MGNSLPRPGKMPFGATPWQIGVRAARANLIPGLVLQGAAAAFVAAYYFSPGFHALLQHLVDGQNRYGIGFTVLTRVQAWGEKLLNRRGAQRS